MVNVQTSTGPEMLGQDLKCAVDKPIPTNLNELKQDCKEELLLVLQAFESLVYLFIHSAT